MSLPPLTRKRPHLFRCTIIEVDITRRKLLRGLGIAAVASHLPQADLWWKAN
jgi:hypothetical protein